MLANILTLYIPQHHSTASNAIFKLNKIRFGLFFISYSLSFKSRFMIVFVVFVILTVLYEADER